MLCITHLPQIASYADRHLTVRKEVGKRNAPRSGSWPAPSGLQELAEMIGGQHITDTTRAQAQELLDAAETEFAAPGPGRTENNGKPEAITSNRRTKACHERPFCSRGLEPAPFRVAHPNSTGVASPNNGGGHFMFCRIIFAKQTFSRQLPERFP